MVHINGYYRTYSAKYISSAKYIYSERRYYMLLTSRFFQRSLVDISWESLLVSLKPWTLSSRFYLFKREICGHMRIFLLFLYTAEQKVIWSNEKETISIKCNLDGEILSFGKDFSSLILNILSFQILDFSTGVNRKWVTAFVKCFMTRWNLQSFENENGIIAMKSRRVSDQVNR